MAPPTLTTSPSPFHLIPEPLTYESFVPYGTAIVSPLPRHLTKGPPPLPLPQSHIPPLDLANQATALKFSPISPLDNYYAERCPSGQPASARMSMFACFSRQLRDAGDSTAIFDVRILERHPYTTQTFIPLDSTSQQPSPSSNRAGYDEPGLEPLYLAIVAPSLTNQTTTATRISPDTGDSETVTITDPPDLSKVRAFVARDGQAVTYGAGTWHAPMVVMGERRVDFVVVQFANGVGEEDCQEVSFGEGVEVVIGKEMAKL